MEHLNLKSNSIEGDKFIENMRNSEESNRHNRDLMHCAFSEFIRHSEFSAWHIHDGWVKNATGNTGDVLNDKGINVVWIDRHAGYSHSLWQPKVAKRMVIVEDSPESEIHTNQKPFDLYCYHVVRCIPSTANIYHLKLIEIKKVTYNKQAEEYRFLETESAPQSLQPITALDFLHGKLIESDGFPFLKESKKEGGYYNIDNICRIMDEYAEYKQHENL
jgi:hypothetical protein